MIDEWGGILTTLLTLMGGSGAVSDPLESGLSSLLHFLPLFLGSGVLSRSSLIEKALSQLLNTRSASTFWFGSGEWADVVDVVLEAGDGEQVGGQSRAGLLAGVVGAGLESGLATRSVLALSCLRSVPLGA